MTPGTATPIASTLPLPTHGQDFSGEDLNELGYRESVERIDLIDVLGVADSFSCQAHIFEPAGNDVFRNDNTDCGSHFALHGEKACTDRNAKGVSCDARAGAFEVDHRYSTW